jgi:hypothetical protein
MPQRPPRKRAFLAAISNYPLQRLPGPTFDADTVALLLTTRFGFRKADIRRIDDALVKPAALDEGLEWLFEDLEPQDRVVFFYSGHGDRLERDGEYVEALVCVDGSRYYDDHFVQLTARAPVGTFTALFDCCFAGGMDRDAPLPFGLRRPSPHAGTWPAAPADVDRDGGPSLPVKPDRDAGIWEYDDNDRDANREPERAPPAREPEAPLSELNGVLFAAARAFEPSDAASALTSCLSPFTWALEKVIEKRGSLLSNLDLFAELRALLRDAAPDQAPFLAVHDPELAFRSFILLEEVAVGSPEETDRDGIREGPSPIDEMEG